jgi:hypothetical protein
MSGWTSADLLDRFLTNLGRAHGGAVQADELWTVARSYNTLADAQEQVYTEFAPMVPHAFVSPPLQLTTADGGRTYTFGANVYPMGHVEVYAEESAGRALYATTYGDLGGDFVIEGALIRSPGNRVRTYARGPFARFVGFPVRMSASVEPSLEPAPARELILWRALSLAAEVSNGELDPSPWNAKYADARQRWVRLWQTQYRGLANAGRPPMSAWWLRMDGMNGVS